MDIALSLSLYICLNTYSLSLYQINTHSTDLLTDAFKLTPPPPPIDLHDLLGKISEGELEYSPLQVIMRLSLVRPYILIKYIKKYL